MKRYVKAISVLLVGMMIFGQSSSCQAAGKTIEAFKNNKYSTQSSDCQVMIFGIKNQVPAYTYVYKNKNSSPKISKADFTGKNKAIKYWASHGSNSGQLWGDSGVNFNVTSINNFKWSGGNLEFVFWRHVTS